MEIDVKISESFATISTWDQRKIFQYEALGRATRKEYEEAVKIMNKFIGREGVFVPKVIIIDKQNNRLETTNRTRLPAFERSKKSRLLEYDVHIHGMPLTNPLDIVDKLEREFSKSKFATTKHQAD
jgi:lysine 2,3-aminomutase